MMRRYGSSFGSFGMIFMMIIQILFWAAIIRGIIALIQRSGTSSRNEDDEALNLLRKKYANGDITKKEYIEKKKDLVI